MKERNTNRRRKYMRVKNIEIEENWECEIQIQYKERE